MHEVERGIKIKCNRGISWTNLVGNFGNFQVWYNEDATAILALPSVAME